MLSELLKNEPTTASAPQIIGSLSAANLVVLSIRFRPLTTNPPTVSFRIRPEIYPPRKHKIGVMIIVTMSVTSTPRHPKKFFI